MSFLALTVTDQIHDYLQFICRIHFMPHAARDTRDTQRLRAQGVDSIELAAARDCASARLGRGSGVRGTHGPRTSRETNTRAV